MGLAEYKRKRRFDQTPEPKGKKKRSHTGHQFVIQKHAARRLHYDFRLEMDGVLKSWAVPKGPSLDPNTRALAVHVEDHPVEYGSFEGTIPKNQYGAGTVLLWDRGTWEAEGNPNKAYQRGKLKFELHGEKLHGRWALVRMSGPAGEGGKNWLLKKINDSAARATNEADILDERPESVASGRTLEQISRAPERIWSDGKAQKPMRATRRKPGTRSKQTAASRTRAEQNSAANSKKADSVRRASANGSGTLETSEIAGIRLTNPQRVLYPEQGVTKRQLAEYYVAIADWILPNLVHRPLSLVRCPRGKGKQCFYQKHLIESMPPPVRGIEVGEDGKSEVFVAVDDLPGLIMLVQMSTLEIHPWGSREDKLDSPDRLIFDLDPGPGVPWRELVVAAHEVRQILAEIGLTTFARTTGGKGIHVVAPLVRRADWGAVKSFARGIAFFLAKNAPDRFVAVATKAKRDGKIYVDYLRNGRGATAIASYSTRARTGAPVATPLAWDELTQDLNSSDWNIESVPARLRKLRHDPWAGFDDVRQSITTAMVRQLGR